MRFSEPMNDLIQVRVMHDEKRRLAEVARKSGMTISDLIRKSIMLDNRGTPIFYPGDVARKRG